MACFRTGDEAGEMEDRKESEGRLPETQSIVTTGLPGTARERFLMMHGERGEFLHSLESSSVPNQMFSTTESQSIGNDGPGSDYSSSNHETINMSKGNTCLHI